MTADAEQTAGADHAAEQHPVAASHRADRVLRWTLGAAGVAAIGYGALRILEQSRYTHPSKLLIWLIGALLVHDAIIAPIVIGLGALLTRVVPGRARGYLQGGLVVAGLVSVVAVVEINRRNKTASPALALLRQNYLTNLVVLVLAITLVTVVAYLISVVRANRRNTRPPADH